MRNSKGQFVDGKEGELHRFQPGHATWNKGKRGYMGANATSFKKGNLGPATLPEGTVSRYERTKNGRKEIVYSINIDWHGKRKPHNSYKWYLWEVENQQDRPKGMILAVKNGNQDDIRIENLEVISRAENMRRNSWLTN